MGDFIKDLGDFLVDPLDLVSGAGIDDIKDAAQDLWGGISGETAAEASREAAQTQAGYQQQALDYLKEREALPIELRDQALMGLQDLYMGDGRADMLESIKQDPIYTAAVQEAEQGALRGASAAGLSRSGAVPAALSRIAPSILQDVYQDKVSGIKGLAGLQGNASEIASGMRGLGSTYAQGLLGAANAEQAGLGNIIDLGTQIGSFFFSDPSLKDNVRVVGEYKGVPWCEWEWNEKAEKIGLKGDGCGVMADDIKEVYPHLLKEFEGHLMVDYGGLANA